MCEALTYDSLLETEKNVFADVTNVYISDLELHVRRWYSVSLGNKTQIDIQFCPNKPDVTDCNNIKTISISPQFKEKVELYYKLQNDLDHMKGDILYHMSHPEC